MKKNIFLLLALLSVSFAYGQYEDQNPRPIDSTEESYGQVLNQMERVDGEGDEEDHRQEMQEKPDESLPGYDTPEEGYVEDVSW